MSFSGLPAPCRQVRPWVPHFTLDAQRIGSTGTGSTLKFAASHQVGTRNTLEVHPMTPLGDGQA